MSWFLSLVIFSGSVEKPFVLEPPWEMTDCLADMMGDPKLESDGVFDVYGVLKSIPDVHEQLSRFSREQALFSDYEVGNQKGVRADELFWSVKTRLAEMKGCPPAADRERLFFLTVSQAEWNRDMASLYTNVLLRLDDVVEQQRVHGFFINYVRMLQMDRGPSLRRILKEMKDFLGKECYEAGVVPLPCSLEFMSWMSKGKKP